jgi:hypothetical protein
MFLAVGFRSPPLRWVNAMHSKWIAERCFAVALAVSALGGLECATQRKAARDQPTLLTGRVLDDRDAKPIEGAIVSVCSRNDNAPVQLIGMGSRCETEISRAVTDSNGSFRLALGSLSTDDGIRVELTAPGYLSIEKTLRAQTSQQRPEALTIRLRLAPVVDVTILGPDERPLQHGGLGWLVEEAGFIRAQHTSHFSSQQGTLSFGPEGVPEGKITFFATTAGEDPHFGTTTVATKSAGRYAVTLRTDKPMLRVRGRVVDDGGRPLVAVVSIVPTQPDLLSPLDRVLEEARGQETDIDGDFEFRITSPAQVSLRLSTWRGRGQGAEHVQLRPLSESPALFEVSPKPILLKAPPGPIVHCSMRGSAEQSLALMELGLSFVPHQEGKGHSGSCVWAGGKAIADQDAKRTFPHEVSFFWPDGVETLLVTGYSTTTALPTGEVRSYVGEVALNHPTDLCQIRGI